MSDYIQVMTSLETEEDAQRVSHAVVERRLAACAQVIGPISSTYWWQGQVETAVEWLCLIKSRRDRYAELERAILELHPYEVPEVLALPVMAGSQGYQSWLDSELGGVG